MMTVKLRPLAAALALVLALATVGTVAAVRNHHGPRASSSPTPPPQVAAAVATPAPTAMPTPTPVPPPAGIDLLWRTVPGDAHRIEAIDWSGAVRGGLALDTAVDRLHGVLPTADGQRLLVGSADMSEETVLTAQGRTVARMSVDPKVGEWSWADKGDHLCGLLPSPQAPSAQLEVLTVGGQARTVATMAWPAGDGGAYLVACSMASDLAVVSVSLGDDSAGHVVDYRVMRISTGRTVRDVRPPAPDLSGSEPKPAPGALDSVSASADAKLLVLAPYTARPGSGPSREQIVDAVSGRVLGHVTGFVQGFSGDDSAVVTEAGRVDWRTGRITGTVPRCCDGLYGSRPGSAEVIVSVATAPPATMNAGASPTPPPDDFVLLRADGTTLRLACCGARLL
jgi:hypothetical protein